MSRLWPNVIAPCILDFWCLRLWQYEIDEPRMEKCDLFVTKAFFSRAFGRSRVGSVRASNFLHSLSHCWVALLLVRPTLAFAIQECVWIYKIGRRGIPTRQPNKSQQSHHVRYATFSQPLFELHSMSFECHMLRGACVRSKVNSVGLRKIASLFGVKCRALGNSNMKHVIFLGPNAKWIEIVYWIGILYNARWVVMVTRTHTTGYCLYL